MVLVSGLLFSSYDLMRISRTPASNLVLFRTFFSFDPGDKRASGLGDVRLWSRGVVGLRRGDGSWAGPSWLVVTVRASGGPGGGSGTFFFLCDLGFSLGVTGVTGGGEAGPKTDEGVDEGAGEGARGGGWGAGEGGTEEGGLGGGERGGAGGGGDGRLGAGAAGSSTISVSTVFTSFSLGVSCLFCFEDLLPTLSFCGVTLVLVAISLSSSFSFSSKETGSGTFLPGEVSLLNLLLGATVFFGDTGFFGILALSSGVRWSTHLASKSSMSILQWSCLPQWTWMTRRQAGAVQPTLAPRCSQEQQNRSWHWATPSSSPTRRPPIKNTLGIHTKQSS